MSDTLRPSESGGKPSAAALAPWLVGLLLLACWYAAVLWLEVPRIILPAPHQVAEAAWNSRSELLLAAGRTFRAALIGFTSAAAAGVVISAIIASSSIAKRSLFPWVILMQMIPVVVFAPIIVIAFERGVLSVTLISFLISFFPVVAGTVQGLESTDRNLVELFRMNQASRLQEIFLLRLPHALPYFLAGLKVAASLVTIGALTAEIFGGVSSRNSGLGFLIEIYRRRGDTPELYATALTAAAVGFIFVAGVVILQRLLLRGWHESATERR